MVTWTDMNGSGGDDDEVKARIFVQGSEVTFTSDGGGAARIGLGRGVRQHRDLDAEQRRADGGAEQRLVALVIGMRDEGDAGRQHFRTSRLNVNGLTVVCALKAHAVVSAFLFTVFEFSLCDSSLESHIPERRGFGLVGLATSEIAQERAL